MQETIKLTVPEDVLEGWREIADLLARILGVPAALVMRLREDEIEVLVASRGEGNPYRPGDREHFAGSGLYCETVINSGKKLLVPDALADENWKENPDVKLNMISYLGFPIFLPDGRPFGTLCVLDRRPNEYSTLYEDLMLKFKAMIESNLELLYLNQILGDRNKGLSDYLAELQTLRGMISVCSNCKAIRDREGNWHPIEHYLIRHPEADFSHGVCPTCWEKIYPDFPDES